MKNDSRSRVLVTAGIGVAILGGVWGCGAGGSDEAPNKLVSAVTASGGQGSTAGTVLPAAAEAILGFENAAQWTASTGSLEASTNASGGLFALAVVPTNYTTYKSAALSTLGAFSGVAFDLWLPTTQPNPFWFGTVQVFMDVPSQNIHNAYLGQVELTGQPTGQWTARSFSVPSAIESKLATATYSDLTFTIALNVPGTPGTYLLDSLRLRRQFLSSSELPPMATKVTAAQLQTLPAAGALVEISPDTRAQAKADFDAKTAAAKALLAPVLATAPELKARLEQPPPARVTVDPDGNWTAHSADGNGGTRTLKLQGPALRYQSLAASNARFNTLANQTAIYNTAFPVLPKACAAGLPSPTAIGALSLAALTALNVSISDCVSSVASTFGSVAQDHQGFVPTSLPELGAPTASGSGSAGFDGDVNSACIGRGFNSNELYAKQSWVGKGFDSRVKDQGTRGACVAFGVTAALERQATLAFGQHVNLSEQALYARMKLFWDRDDLNDGFDPNEALDDMGRTGYLLPFENHWIYNPSPFRLECGGNAGCRPSAGDDLDSYEFSCGGGFLDGGIRYLGPACSDTSHQAEGVYTPASSDPSDGNVLAYYWAPVGSGVVGLAGHQNLISAYGQSAGTFPVFSKVVEYYASIGQTMLLTFDAYDSFLGLWNGSGIWQGKSASDTGVVGGHLVQVSGIVRNDQLQPGIPPGSGGGYLIIKNSWGQCWGDNGYGYMSFDAVEQTWTGFNVITAAQPLVNTAPSLTILTPANGAVIPLGGLDTLSPSMTATTNDVEDGANVSAVAWTSDRQGALGSGLSIAPVITVPGLHTITATATDSQGNTTSASVQVTYVPSPVSLTISLPTAQQQVPQGSPLVLLGSGAFISSTAVPCTSLVWTDSVASEALNLNAGQSSQGCQVTAVFATLGLHTITLAKPATASSLAASTSVTINVVPPGTSPLVLIADHIGTALAPFQVNANSGTGPLTFTGVVDNEPLGACLTLPAGTTNCATTQWTSLCGGSAVPLSGEGIEVGSGLPGSIFESANFVDRIKLDPFSVTVNPKGCADLELSLCVSDPTHPTPQCASTFLHLTPLLE